MGSTSRTALAADALPSMIGFDVKRIGIPECEWTSPCYLLADRDLELNEVIRVWAVDKHDGRLLKVVELVATESNRHKDKWPAALVQAIRDDETLIDRSKQLHAGVIKGTEFETGTSSYTSADLLKGASTADCNRLWVFSTHARLFTNAPFAANQVIATDLADVDLCAVERLCVQVRDRTSQGLFESLMVNQVAKDDAEQRAKRLCDAVGQESAVLRAGVLAKDGVSIAPGRQGNALWLPQHSELAVTVLPVLWVKHADFSAPRPLNKGETLYIHVHDDITGSPLSGSPLVFTPTDEQLDVAQWPVALAAALKESKLAEYLKLHLDDGSGTTSGQWERASIPLRIVMSEPLETATEWAPMWPELDGPGAITMKALLSKFEAMRADIRAHVKSVKPEAVGDDAFRYVSLEAMNALAGCARLEIELLDRRTGHVCYRWVLKFDGASDEAVSDFTAQLIESMGKEGVCGVKQCQAQPTESSSDPMQSGNALWVPSRLGLVAQMRWRKRDVAYSHGAWAGLTTHKLTTFRRWGAINVFDAAEKLERVFRFQETIANLRYAGDSADKQKDIDREVCAAFARIESIELDPLLGVKTEQEMLMARLALEAYAAYSAGCSIEALKDDPNISFILDRFEELRVIRPYGESDKLPAEELEHHELNRILGLEEYFAGITRSIDSEGLEEDLSSSDCTSFQEYINKKVLSQSRAGIFDYIRKKAKDYRFNHFALDKDLAWALSKLDEKAKHTINLDAHRRYKNPIVLDDFIVAVIGSIRSDRLIGFTEAPQLKLENPSYHPEATNRFICEFMGNSPSEIAIKNTDHSITLCDTLLHLQMEPDAVETGIRFASLRNDYLFDAREVHFIATGNPSSKGAGIVGAFATATTPLYMPFHLIHRSSQDFSATYYPDDSLCADRCMTQGAHVYDTGGARENGVDENTGLFHAHYPLATLRGLAGKGPELDLTLHYSAVRANESALGDGWAFRFSYFDNRRRVLTLSTGQTLLLKKDEMKRLSADKTRFLDQDGFRITAVEGNEDALTSLTIQTPPGAEGRQEVLKLPATHDKIEAGQAYNDRYKEKLEKIIANLTQWIDKEKITSEQIELFKKEREYWKNQLPEYNRKGLVLVTTSIRSPQGGELQLAWTGVKGHIQLNTITDKDTGTKLLEAAHDMPATRNTVHSVFTVWPDTQESYQVTLDIENCLLKSLKRHAVGAANRAERCVRFGYTEDYALDFVLTAIAEEDGSIEVVSYGRGLNGMSPRVAVHTLIPGADQNNISHAYQWQGDAYIDQVRKTRHCSSERGDASFVETNWSYQNGMRVVESVIEEQPGISRRTTRFIYPEKATDPDYKYLVLSRPIKTEVTIESLDKGAEEQQP